MRADESLRPVADPSQLGLIAGAAIATSVAAGIAAAIAGPATVVVAAGAGVFGLVAWRPVLATYVYLAMLPFLAGIERGLLVPLLRPNEALLLLVLGGAAAGGYVRAMRGAELRLRLNPVDVPLAAFVLLSTVWPISSMLLRGVPPHWADVAAVLPICKLAGLLLLVRTTVVTPTQVRWCIRLIIGGAVGVAAIAVLQRLNIGPIPELIATWWPAGPEQFERGTSTLSNAIAAGDYILIGLSLLVSSGVRGLLSRWTLGVAGLVLVVGILATAQFSTWLGALIVGTLLVWRLPEVRGHLLRLTPILGVIVLASAPILVGRFREILEGSAPQSWLVRWDNLTYFYIPRLVHNGQFLVGVSPNSVVVPPDTARDVVFLESGYLQFLWVGGLPLLLAFVALSAAVFRLTRRLESRTDSVGACAFALAVAWWMVLVLSLTDIHLFTRGVGDLIFILLGIVTGRAVADRADNASE